MKRFSMSDIEIRQDIDQKLAHKYDSPNKEELVDDEVGYYVLDNSNQLGNDHTNSKIYLLDDDGSMIEMAPTGIEKTSMNWNETKEGDKWIGH